MEPLFVWSDEHLGGVQLIAVGYRVVHGGASFRWPVVIDDPVLAALDALCRLARLHQPHNLPAIRTDRAPREDLPHVACFDAAFPQGHADAVTRFAPWGRRGVTQHS